VRRIFLDTEFTDLPWTGRSELLWVGLVDEQGRQCSAVLADTDVGRCSDFVRTQVLPQIPAEEPRLHRGDLAALVLNFCGEVDEFWAWFPSRDDLIGFGVEEAAAGELLRRLGDWDYQLLRQIVGQAADAWPRECRDLHALADAAGIALPDNPRAHHPVHDAAWGRQVYEAVKRNP
jgi:hypothetical protein